MDPEDPVAIEGRLVMYTAKAVLIDHEDAGQVWLPLSQIFWRAGDLDRYSLGDMIEFDVPRWLVDKKGLR